MRRRSQVALGLLSLATALVLAAASAGPRVLAVVLEPKDTGVGGLSALELDAKGERLVALSDSGAILTGRIERDAGGVASLFLSQPLTLRDTKGRPLRRGFEDAEGLALRSDGRLFVSFEGTARVWTYSGVGSEAAWLPRHPDFKKMAINGSLEALAIAPNGQLYTLPEDPARDGSGYPVYRYRNGEWSQPFTLPPLGRHRPVGADFGPDGKLYLLERDFSWMGGFSSRLRRFTVSPDRLVSEGTLWSSPRGQHDNLEGIAVWRDAGGQLWATMISDDNHNPLQKTELVEIALPP